MFMYQTPITKDDVPELLEKVEREKVIVQKKCEYNKKIINLAGLFFTVCLLLMLISLIALDPNDGAFIKEKLSFLNPVVTFVHKTFIFHPGTETFVRVLMCIGFVVIPPIVISLLLKLICGIGIHTLKNENYSAKGDIFDLLKEANALKAMYTDTDQFSATWTIVLAGPTVGLYIWVLVISHYKNLKEFFEMIVGTVIGVVFLCFIYFFVFKLLFSIIPQFRLNRHKITNDFIEAIDTACEKETEEQEALKKQREQERIAEEQARRAKKKADDMRKGKELYKQAIAGNEIDEDLMRTAADLGDPNAGIYIGSNMLKNVGWYTTSELKFFYNKAKPYFKAAFEANIPDGVFLYCNAVMITESMTHDQAYDLLKRFRAINKNDLSSALKGTYDSSLKSLVNIVNELKEKLEEEREEERRRRNPPVFIDDVMRRMRETSSNGSYGRSTYDDAALDMVSQHMRETYGDNWTSDL